MNLTIVRASGSAGSRPDVFTVESYLVGAADAGEGKIQGSRIVCRSPHDMAAVYAQGILLRFLHVAGTRGDGSPERPWAVHFWEDAEAVASAYRTRAGWR